MASGGYFSREPTAPPRNQWVPNLFKQRRRPACTRACAPGWNLIKCTEPRPLFALAPISRVLLYEPPRKAITSRRETYRRQRDKHDRDDEFPSDPRTFPATRRTPHRNAIFCYPHAGFYGKSYSHREPLNFPGNKRRIFAADACFTIAHRPDEYVYLRYKCIRSLVSKRRCHAWPFVAGENRRGPVRKF